MKSALTHVLLLLCAIGVFGDAEKVETVSVIEGKSVTLHTGVGVAEIQSSNSIEWTLNGIRIARISGDDIITEGSSRDRLQLDKQTGDLKITNIKTTDSGQYKLKIRNARGSPEKTFNVSVDPRFDGVTVVSVTEGDSVVLHADTEILKDDEIQWRFGEKYVIAKMKKDEHIFSTYEDIADGIFRHRLQLNYQTGNLIISDIRSNTSGLYEVDVKKSTYTIHKTFSVTITDILIRLSVKEGVTVILDSGVTELHRDDLVRWRFEHELLAKINKTSSTSYVRDERFRDRLQLNDQTGSLTITNTRTTDSGRYDLDITSDRHVISRTFVLSVSDDVKWIVPTAAAVGFAVGVLVAAAACVIYRFKRTPKLYGKQPVRRGSV